MARNRKIKESKVEAAESQRSKSRRPRPKIRSGKNGSRRTGQLGSEPSIPITKRQILPGPWKTNALMFLLFTIATVALYAGDLRLGFLDVDDPGYVVNNSWIKGVTLENLRHIVGAPYFANYSPVHLLSYMLDYAVAGSSPFVFHLSSNIWAGLVSGFVFLVALALTGRRAVALAAAALFVVHPAHVEAIAWISSRKDLLAAAFALPSLIAYLRYRQGGPTARRWYVLSLLLFLLALAGKLSVATFPAVFLAFDLFVEKRPMVRSLVDKVPFLVAAGLIALIVASAQPASGNPPDPYVFSVALLQNLWLLSGFASYVIFRVPPAPVAGTALVAAVFLLAIFAAPLLLRRRLPLVVVLVYWIFFAFIPSQILSFVHPVTDRYLFFPSVAAVILIAWGAIAAGEKLGRRGVLGAVVLLAAITMFWGWATLAYLAEWRDPRSVWYAATGKSSDTDVYYSIGAHYLNEAERLGTTPRGTSLPEAEARGLASAVWAGDPRLPALLAEWTGAQRGGPVEKQFQDHLRTLAWDELERSLRSKGARAMPNLYYRRGVLLLERGDLPGARKEFLDALDETSRSTVGDVREEITVNSYNALGVIAFKQGDFREALRWYRQAEEEQTRFGGNWVPDISANRKRMEATVAMLPGGSAAAKSDDPEVCYSLGVRYLDAAGRLGVTPQGTPLPAEEAQQLAKDVWAEDPRLAALQSEWANGRHGGTVEQEFQDHLRTLAWDAFERALHAKGTRVMPNIYFRRGMTLGERGDLRGAREEFLAALDEAARDPAADVQHEVTVTSHDALGVIAWKAQDYKEALRWFRIAEDEQARFGGRWVPDITAKRQRMEALSKQ
jgi:tetratricopeptide (TPR) repeat protein